VDPDPQHCLYPQQIVTKCNSYFDLFVEPEKEVTAAEVENLQNILDTVVAKRARYYRHLCPGHEVAAVELVTTEHPGHSGGQASQVLPPSLSWA
jgi:hypothetical protein